jgi:hypothetical protein
MNMGMVDVLFNCCSCPSPSPSHAGQSTVNIVNTVNIPYHPPSLVHHHHQPPPAPYRRFPFTMTVVSPSQLAFSSPNKRGRHDPPSSSSSSSRVDGEGGDQPVAKRSRTGERVVLAPATQTGTQGVDQDDEVDRWHATENEDGQFLPVSRNGLSNGHDHVHAKDENGDEEKYEDVEDEDGTIIRRAKVVRKAFTRDKDG